MRFEEAKPLFYLLFAFGLIGYGFFLILSSSFAQPSGSWIDKTLMTQIGIGCFYSFSGIWVLVERPEFVRAGIVLFIAFMIEIGRIGTY